MIADIQITGVILAGGLSRRMNGVEKSLLELNGETLVARAARLLAPQCSPIVLNANGDPARFASALPVQPDTIEGFAGEGFAGPLAGVLAGMVWSRMQAPQASHVLTVATDTPFFPNDLAERFAEALINNNTAIAMATSNGRRHPVFALWPTALAADLEAFLKKGDERKIMIFVQRHKLIEVEFASAMAGGAGQTVDPFFNINTPEDFDAANRLLTGEAA